MASDAPYQEKTPHWPSRVTLTPSRSLARSSASQPDGAVLLGGMTVSVHSFAPVDASHAVNATADVPDWIPSAGVCGKLSVSSRRPCVVLTSAAPQSTA